MDLDEQLLFQRQSARLSELEHWLAMLIVRHGQATAYGWRYEMCDAHALLARAELPRSQMSVNVDYDVQRAAHTLDVM